MGGRVFAQSRKNTGKKTLKIFLDCRI
jgi:hypothetical protein